MKLTVKEIEILIQAIEMQLKYNHCNVDAEALKELKEKLLNK